VMRAHDEAEGDVCRLEPPTHFRVVEALRTGQSAVPPVLPPVGGRTPLTRPCT
jgi:hypothetical protein